MQINKVIAFFLAIYFLLPAICFADKIKGNACYTYGDNESLVQAEQMTKTLAIRNAIESYSVFIQSTTKVTNLQVSSDLINAVSAGQVKRIEILKRLQSGRKLCYTVEGNVEPNDFKKAIREYLSGKHKLTTGRVKENEWIKIVDSYLEKGKNENPFSDLLGKDKYIGSKLHVQIEFLKPCTATDSEARIKDNYKREWEKSFAGSKPELNLSPESWAYFILNAMSKEKQYDAKSWKNYETYCEKNGIDPWKFFSDLMVPRFRCDNKLQVFVTFLSSSGLELKTEGEVPFAYIINDKSKERKVDMVSGERTFVTFIIPENVESWEIWVPK